MKIQIELSQEQLNEVEKESQLLDQLEASLIEKFPSLWKHIHKKGYSDGGQEADDYYSGAGCGCCC